MLLLALVLHVATVLASSPGSIASETSRGNPVSSGSHVAEAESTQHADLKARDDCPVPSPNLEAQCSATALPSDTTKTITLGDSTQTITIPAIVVLTSLVRSTKLVTKTVNLSQTGHESLRTSLVTLTSVETSTRTYTSPLSKPTVIGSHHHNATEISEKQKTGMSTTTQAAIGASVAEAAIIVAVLLWFCLRKRKRSQQQAREEPQDGDGPPRNFAQVQNNNPPSMRSADIPSFLQPRQSAILSGPNNPYANSPDSPAPPYHAAPAHAYVAGYQQPPARARSPMVNSQQQFRAPPAPVPPPRSGRPARSMPPRRPVAGMRPTAEDDYDY